MESSATLNIDLNTKDNSGKTAFHFACGFGCINVAKLIMENSATLSIDLNAKDNSGQTAFHLAFKFDHFSVAKMIIENSAIFSIDLNEKDNEGLTAFNQVCNHGMMKLIKNNTDTFKIDLSWPEWHKIP
jgi:ankyrin repeat protein